MTWVEEIADRMRGKSTDELLAIWSTNNQEEWSDDAFEAIKQILFERGVALPTHQARKVNTETTGSRIAQCNNWDLGKIKKKRKAYLLVFLLMVVGYVLMAVAKVACSLTGFQGAVAVYLIIGIIFLILFANTVRETLGYSGGELVGLSFVILFVPWFSILAIAAVDRKIYDAIKRKEEPTRFEGKRELCAWAVWSLVFFWVPFIGLLMGVKAIKDIRLRPTELYGATLAWIATGLGVLDTLAIAAITFCGTFVWK